jgi:diaminohydroxyphosphoribosylaminopyrimidine deaminase/5-amino-6-(5-phosphoribosylamino)uracil reductase
VRDEAYVRLVLALARRGLGRAWPNPSVGAVIVAAGHDRIAGCAPPAPAAAPRRNRGADIGRGGAGGTLYVTGTVCPSA